MRFPIELRIQLATGPDGRAKLRLPRPTPDCLKRSRQYLVYRRGMGGGLPFDKLRDPDRGLFGGPGQEMKFNGRLDRGKD